MQTNNKGKGRTLDIVMLLLLLLGIVLAVIECTLKTV